MRWEKEPVGAWWKQYVSNMVSKQTYGSTVQPSKTTYQHDFFCCLKVLGAAPQWSMWENHPRSTGWNLLVLPQLPAPWNPPILQSHKQISQVAWPSQAPLTPAAQLESVHSPPNILCTSLHVFLIYLIPSLGDYSPGKTESGSLLIPICSMLTMWQLLQKHFVDIT